MEAAQTEIVRVEAKPGITSTEFGTMASGDVLGIVGLVTDVLPPSLRWIPMVGMFVLKAFYIISRGMAKKPPSAVVPSAR
jgi:hypothetical protein